jgi:hypothetical protein
MAASFGSNGHALLRPFITWPISLRAHLGLPGSHQPQLLLVFGVLAAQGLRLLCMHLPPMRKVLGTTTVNLQQWAAMLARATGMILVMEIFELARRALGSSRSLWT